MSCGVGRKPSLDLMLLWMLAAITLIRPLAWEPPHAMGVGLKTPKNKRRKKERNPRGGNDPLDISECGENWKCYSRLETWSFVFSHLLS